MFMIFTIGYVNSYYLNSAGYVKQIDKTIIVTCNIQAFQETKNEAIYKCIVDNNRNCNLLENYRQYNIIITECIDEKRASSTVGIIIGLVFILLISYCQLH